MPYGYIASREEYQKVLEQTAAMRRNVVADCWKLGPQDLPPVEMMKIIGSADAGHFKAVMVQFFEEIARRFSIGEDSCVVDLGCGCGRLAYPFARYLSKGRYVGFDVWKDGIDWCTNHISAHYPNCKFHLVGSKNNYYFEARDSTKTNNYSLEPLPNASVDAVIAVSVFTHLTRADCQAYLREIARTLTNGGCLFITSFIIDRFFHAYVAETGFHRAVQPSDDPGCYYAYSGQDFFAGYTRERWIEMFDVAGLEIVSMEPGSWAQKPGARTFQDTYVAVKP